MNISLMSQLKKFEKNYKKIELYKYANFIHMYQNGKKGYIYEY